MSEDCINCIYCRKIEDTNEYYCKQTYSKVYEYTSACDDFVENNDDY